MLVLLFFDIDVGAFVSTDDRIISAFDVLMTCVFMSCIEIRDSSMFKVFLDENTFTRFCFWSSLQFLCTYLLTILT